MGLDKAVLTNPTEHVREKVIAALGRNSYGLNIILVDVILIPQAQTPQGVVPAWAVVYFAKGMIIGTFHKQLTLIVDPFSDDAVYDSAIAEGCAQLRQQKAQAGNGVPKL